VTDAELQGIAMELAREAMDAGEVPIGAVVVREGVVIGRGRNRMEELQDATAHAEMFALREASRSVGSWRLDGCELFATLEPCPMCAGAILNSRIARVVYGAPDHRLGACRTHWAILERNPIGREIEVVDGVLAKDSADLLRGFFRALREGDRRSSSDRLGDRDAIA
jgi:tRNA(adenine34) deaminase